MKKDKIILGALTLVFLVLIGYTFSTGILSPDSKETRKDPIRIGSPSWVGNGPFYLAKEKKFFEKEGVEVELIRTDDIYEERLMLKKGEIDMQAISADMVVVYNDMGLPMVAVLELDRSLGGDGIVATSEIKDVADLKDKHIALPKGTVSHFFLLYLLKEENLTSNDVDIIDTDIMNVGPSFMADTVDAAVTWEPLLSKAEEREGGHILISSRDRPGIIVDVLTVRRDTIKERPEDIKAVMRAWFDALEYWKTNRDESNRIMANAYNLPVEDFEAMTASLEWVDYDNNLRFFKKTEDNTTGIYSIVGTAGEIYYSEGLIQKIEDETMLVNGTFLETVMVSRSQGSGT